MDAVNNVPAIICKSEVLNTCKYHFILFNKSDLLIKSKCFFCCLGTVSPTVALCELPFKYQDLSSQLIISSSRSNSSFQQLYVQVTPGNFPLFTSYASFATKKKDGDSDLRQCDNISLSLSKPDVNNRTLVNNIKKIKNENDLTSKQSTCDFLYDSEDFTKLDLNENDLLTDNKDTGMSLFASCSSGSSNSGSATTGGSGSKKQGSGRKQSGSDKSGFVNCLSCGLPCSKLDTECK